MMPDSRFPVGDPSKFVAVGPVLATATLVQYEWWSTDVTDHGNDASALNRLFLEGWKFDSVAGKVYLLKREVKS